MQELQGKVAVVTGGASGIGRAMAGRFAAEGMKLVLADVEEQPLTRAADELRAQGADVKAVRTDVSDAAAVAALADRAFAAYGAVHLLCNNAGVVSPFKPIWEQTEEDWRWVLGVNLMGVVHGLRAFVPRMLQQDGEGHIVNTASIAGLTTIPFLDPYNVTKHGVVVLSESLALELQAAGSAIGVSVLCPGLVRTRIGEAERNRPDALKNGQQATVTRNGAALGEGIAVEGVAALVLDAITNRRFYIRTHDEWESRVRARAEGVIENRYPTLAAGALGG